MINTTNRLPYHECPSFDRCSAPKCSLDPYIDERDAVAGEEKCRAHKPTRTEIGSKYPELLLYKGLTKREWLGRRGWDSLSTTQQTLAVERLAKSLKVAKATLEV